MTDFTYTGTPYEWLTPDLISRADADLRSGNVTRGGVAGSVFNNPMASQDAYNAAIRLQAARQASGSQLTGSGLLNANNVSAVTRAAMLVGAGFAGAGAFGLGPLAGGAATAGGGAAATFPLAGGGPIGVTPLGAAGAGAATGTAAGAGGAMAGLNWANVGSSLISGLLGIAGSREEAKAADNAGAISQRQFDIARNDVLPQINAGNAAIDTLADLEGLYTGVPNRARFTSSPGYQYIYDETMRATDRSLAARGKALSGQAVKESQRNAAGLAQQDYGRFVDQLLATAGHGTTGAALSSSAGANNAAYRGGAEMAKGVARSSGYGAVNDAVQGYQTNSRWERELEQLYARRP